ncbi:MAG: UDP-glucose--hexose-1-phosphate uridylyltransferase, partial [Bacteroidota bacterium]
MHQINNLQSGYQANLPFKADLIAHAPGRINIIGEHTDYNGGFVLPAAIAEAVSIAVRKHEDEDTCILHALDLGESYQFRLSQLAPKVDGGWPNYLMGVVHELKQLGGDIKGFEAAIGGNVPLGSGMSSSAAVECATAFALNGLFDLGFDKLELIKAAQLAEHHYVGTKCGIMDQFASVMGAPNAVIRLDCESLDYAYFPLILGEYELLFLNTNVSHSLADSAYNDRRAACEKGVQILQQYYPEVSLLRHVDPSMLEKHKGELGERVYTRCQFIVQEIARVLQACEALLSKDFEQLGALMYETHEGLSKAYEVSCPELDFLVDATKDKDYIIGARMMGGGFGGCTINLIKKGYADLFIDEVGPAYLEQFGKAMTPIRTTIGEGARISYHNQGLDFDNDPHRRLNILTGEWVLVSPHRTKRPWQGKQEEADMATRPTYDPNCYLCPGNTRAGGKVNPNYTDTFVFDNDFGALLPHSSSGQFQNGLMRASGEQGACRVICFSPDHSLTLPQMELSGIRKVVDLWADQYQDLSAKDFINHVQIFENKGAIQGCSNPHPHGQIWAQSSIPQEAAKKLEQQKAYWVQNGRSLLGDYLLQEMSVPNERIILDNDSFVALVPFWATWPYECMIIPKRHFQDITQMTEAEKDDFSAILKALTIKLDNIFQTSFPYSSGLVQRPTDGKAHEYWHFHMSFYPPLLRSATVKKFMVGYE